ncbi:hypothetical protein BHM03_00008343 [Ensete ventricosum]|nr:hypothetical protein BHM03_00008343 [Ensete ventricosum]
MRRIGPRVRTNAEASCADLGQHQRMARLVFVRQQGADKIRRAMSGGAELRKHGHDEIIRKPIEVIRPLLDLRRRPLGGNSRPFPAAGLRSSFRCSSSSPLPLPLLPRRSSAVDPRLGPQALGSTSGSPTHLCLRLEMSRTRSSTAEADDYLSIIGNANPDAL